MAEPNDLVVQNNRKLEQLVDDCRVWTYTSLQDNSPVIDKVAKTYVKVFGETGDLEWGETWDDATVRATLLNDLSIRSDISPTLSTLEKGEDVVGFAVGYSLSVENLGNSEMPYDVPDEEKERITQEIQSLLRNKSAETILFFKELGVLVEARGGFERIQALMKTVMREGLRENATEVIFWTNKNSRLYKLVIGLGAEILYEVGNDLVFLSAPLKEKFDLLNKEPNEVVKYMHENLTK